MRLAASILTVCCLANLCAFAAEDDGPAPVVVCPEGVPGTIACPPSSRDLKQAHTDFTQGKKFQEQQHLEEAFVKFDEAARLAPQDGKVFEARELVKARLVYQHTAQGDALMANGGPELAVAEFRAALDLDPDNSYIQERLGDSLRNSTPLDKNAPDNVPELLSESAEIHLQPKPEHATFHFEGDSRELLTQLTSAYGVTV